MSTPARKPATSPSPKALGPKRNARIGLALAGGGPLGATYEIGALCALQESVHGLDVNQLDGYVGVSAGAFIAAALANGMTPWQLCRGFIEGKGPAADRVDPALFVTPAWGEFAARAGALPALAARTLGRAMSRRRSWLSAMESLGEALPTGLFSHRPLQAHVERMLSQPGRSNDFRQLQRKLVVVATDLDSGQAAPFGLPGLDHIPISQAVAASAALPGLYPPVCIEGRWYVDGALKKTLHASVLLEDGLDLMFCLNPLVPFDASQPSRHKVLGQGEAAIPELVQGGLPVVLSQTFRSLIHSRLELGMRGYQASHPQTDIVLLEPDHRDAEMFLANTFGYKRRRAMAEHAYQHTRAALRSQRSSLAQQLAAHGLKLNHDALDDTQRTLVLPRSSPLTGLGRGLRQLDEVLNDLERTLAAPRSARNTP